MTINDQIRDEKLQYDINREAAKISALSSGKIYKYEYLTGEDILPSNQQQIIEQAKFTYFPLGKAFEKQIKTIEDQGEKQIDALKDLKPKEQTKLIEDKSNNQPKVTTIFNELIKKRKELMSELYDSVDYNNLNFEYVGPTKSVSFYEYMDSKELFNARKNNQIKFSEVKDKKNEFLNKLSNIKIGKKPQNKKKLLIILKNFTILEKKLLTFLETILKCYLMLNMMQNKIKLREQDLKY